MIVHVVKDARGLFWHYDLADAAWGLSTLKACAAAVGENYLRAIRSYMAGLGAAGSLVLGAFLLFVLGSTVVAFNGWPKIGPTASPAVQRITAGHAGRPGPGSGSRVVRAAQAVPVLAASVAPAHSPVAAGIGSPGRRRAGHAASSRTIGARAGHAGSGLTSGTRAGRAASGRTIGARVGRGSPAPSATTRHGSSRGTAAARATPARTCASNCPTSGTGTPPGGSAGGGSGAVGQVGAVARAAVSTVSRRVGAISGVGAVIVRNVSHVAGRPPGSGVGAVIVRNISHVAGGPPGSGVGAAIGRNVSHAAARSASVVPVAGSAAAGAASAASSAPGAAVPAVGRLRAAVAGAVDRVAGPPGDDAADADAAGGLGRRLSGRP
jgi:hypothetical protein